MSSGAEQGHDLSRWPEITLEQGLYNEETDKIIQKRGGEEYVTEEDLEAVEREVQRRLAAEGRAGE